MAYGRKTGGRDFKKGVVTNPKGRPKVSKELKEARKLTSTEFELVCGKLLFMDVEDIKKLIINENTPMMEAIIAKILHNALKDGAKAELNYFVERFLGKVPDNSNLNLTGNVNGGLVDLINAHNEANKTKK